MNRRSTQSILAASTFAAAALLTACAGSEAASDDATTTPAPSAQSTPLDEQVLLTDDQTVYSDGADWFRLGTGDEGLDGNGDLANPCLPGGLSGTGATEVVRADFELRNTADPSVEVSGDLLTQLVGQYDDRTAAAAAAEAVVAALEECTDRPAAITEFRTLATREVPAGQGTGSITDAHFGPLPASLEDGSSAYIMETGVAVAGDRVVVLTSVIVGQDYNFLPEDGGTPVERMLPLAVDLAG
jgi:opacity protein-like surface antigen